MKNTQRILALLLCIALCISFFPVSKAWAEEPLQEENSAGEIAKEAEGEESGEVVNIPEEADEPEETNLSEAAGGEKENDTPGGDDVLTEEDGEKSEADAENDDPQEQALTAMSIENRESPGTEFADEAGLMNCLEASDPDEWAFLTYTGDGPMTFTEDVDLRGFHFYADFQGHDVIISEGVSVATWGSYSQIPELTVNGSLLITGDFYSNHLNFGAEGEIVLRGTLHSGFEESALERIHLSWEEGGQPTLYWKLQITAEEELRQGIAAIDGRINVIGYGDIVGDVVLADDLLIPFNWVVTVRNATMTVPAGRRLTLTVSGLKLDGGHLAIDGVLDTEMEIILNNYNADCSVYSPGGTGRIEGTGYLSINTEEDSPDRFFYGFPADDYLIEDLRAEYQCWRVSPVSNVLYFSDQVELTEILFNWDWTECEKEAVYDGDGPLILTESIPLPGVALKLNLQGRDLVVAEESAVSGLCAVSVGQITVDGSLTLLSMDGFTSVAVSGSMLVAGVMSGSGDIDVFGTLSFGDHGCLRGRESVIRLHRAGTGDRRTISEFLPGLNLQKFSASQIEDGWELSPETGHWIELLGLDDYNPPEDPNLTGTRARVKVQYNLDRSDSVHTSTPMHLLQVFLSTDPNFYKTDYGMNRADVKAQMMGMPFPVEEFPNTEVFFLTELVPNTTYYYVAHLVDPMTTDLLAVSPTDELQSFTTGSFDGQVIDQVGGTAAGECISFTAGENGAYSLTIPEEYRIASGTIRVRDANSGTVIAEDFTDGKDGQALYSVFLAESGRTYYIYAQGFEADENEPDGIGRTAIYFPVTLNDAENTVPRVPANGSVISQGSRAVCLEAWSDTACVYTVTGISSMGNLAIANLNTMSWDVFPGNIAKLTLQPGEKAFMKWSGNPTKHVEFAAVDEEHDVMALIRAVDPDSPPDSIRAEMQAIYQADPANVKRMMQLNDTEVASTIREREARAAGGNTAVFITPAARESFAEVKVLGASLNNTEDCGPAMLVVDKPQKERAVPVEERFRVLQFSLTLDNLAGGSSELKFPIAVDLRLNQTGVDRNELVFYHFHGDTDEYDEVCPNVYFDPDTGFWYAKLYLTGLSDFAMVYMPGGSGSDGGEDAPILVKELSLDHDYLAMKPEDQAEIKAMIPDAAVPISLSWSVETVEGEGEVLTVDSTGLVTAVSPGAAFVAATAVWQDGSSTVARCRVDVTKAAAAVESFRLLTPKATVELYRTDYTRIQVIPVLEQNLSAAALKPVILPPPEPEADNGLVIISAKFTDFDTAECFSLRALDDRTLEIIPNPDYVTTDVAVLKRIKKNYKSAIEITVAGADRPVLSSAPLALTVKKSIPKLSAKAVKLNSFYDDTKQIVFAGSIPKAVWPDAEKNQPAWLAFDGESQMVTYSGEPNAKKSGKLYLQAKVEGWAVQLAVTVSVSAAKAAPKLKLKPTTVNLQPGVGDVAESALSITPAIFSNPERYPVSVSIYEGKTLLTNGEELIAAVREQSVFVGEGSSAPDDGRLHTYKVHLSIRGEKPAVLTVKRLAAKTPATLTVKTSGTIDLAIPESPVTFIPTLKNTGSPASSFAIAAITDAAGNDCRNLFHINGLTLTAANGLTKGKYTATVTAAYTYDAKGTASKNVAFTVKQSARIPAPGVTLKCVGSIDVIRPGSYIVLTPVIRNFYTHKMKTEDLVFWKGTGKTAERIENKDEIPFAVKADGQTFVLRLRPGKNVNHLTEKYSVSMVLDNGVESAKLALKIKMGTSKVTQSTKTVQLLKDDRFSRGSVVLGTKDAALSPIDWEKTAAAFASTKDRNGNAFFTLRPLENGECAVCYAGNVMNPAVKSGIVKIKVFFEGNVSGKPNATLSVKVNLV